MVYYKILILTSFIVLVMSVLMVTAQQTPPAKKSAQQTPAPAPKPQQQQQAKPKESKSNPQSAKTNDKQVQPPTGPPSKPPTPSKNVLQKQADEAKKKDPNSPAAKQWEKEAKNYQDKHGPYQMQESKHAGLRDGFKFDPKTGKMVQSSYTNVEGIEDRYSPSGYYNPSATGPKKPYTGDYSRDLGERELIRYNQGEKGSSKHAVNNEREWEANYIDGLNEFQDAKNQIPKPEMLPA